VPVPGTNLLRRYVKFRFCGSVISTPSIDMKSMRTTRFDPPPTVEPTPSLPSVLVQDGMGTKDRNVPS
jgi:hypothetical protein